MSAIRFVAEIHLYGHSYLRLLKQKARRSPRSRTCSCSWPKGASPHFLVEAILGCVKKRQLWCKSKCWYLGLLSHPLSTYSQVQDFRRGPTPEIRSEDLLQMPGPVERRMGRLAKKLWWGNDLNIGHNQPIRGVCDVHQKPRYFASTQSCNVEAPTLIAKVLLLKP